MNKSKQDKEGNLDKMEGIAKSPTRVGFSEIIWSWIGAFLGIAAVSYIITSLKKRILSW